MYPSREEFTELIYYISELKHQYTHKIDEQSIKINDQSMIIEELLWQIRELSDKIRQLNQWKGETDAVISDSRRKFDELTKTCICRYENHIPKSRIINNRRSRNSPSIAQIQRKNDKSRTIDDDDDDDDVYETIEFSDSSHHIYTEPFNKVQQSNYGALRKVNVKTTTTTSSSSYNSKQSKMNVINKRSATSSAPQQQTTKMGIKKSSRMRNLQKYPALQDISKVNNSTDENDDDAGEKVELRTKTKETIDARRSTSRQAMALVSDIEADIIRKNRENLENFIPQRDVSGILINFDYSNSRIQSELRDRVSY